MKKVIIGLLAVLVILSLATGPNGHTASANTIPAVTIDGGKIVQNRTLVPLRSIFEELGAGVQYNAKDKTITAKKGTTTVWLKVGSKTAKINNKAITIDAAPQVYSGSTFVPLRFIGDAFGVKTDWDPRAEAAIVTAPNKKLIVHVGEFDKASTATSLEIKKLPGEIAETVGILPVGADVKVIGGVPNGYDQEDWSNADMYGWSKVKYDGRIGWVPTHKLVFENPYSWAPGIKDVTLNEIKRRYANPKDKIKLVEDEVYGGRGLLTLYIQSGGAGQWNYLVTIDPKTGWWHG